MTRLTQRKFFMSSWWRGLLAAVLAAALWTAPVAASVHQHDAQTVHSCATCHAAHTPVEQAQQAQTAEPYVAVESAAPYAHEDPSTGHSRSCRTRGPPRLLSLTPYAS